MKNLLEFCEAEIKSCEQQCKIELENMKGRNKQMHVLNYNYLIGRKLALSEIKHYLLRREK